MLYKSDFSLSLFGFDIGKFSGTFSILYISDFSLSLFGFDIREIIS